MKPEEKRLQIIIKNSQKKIRIDSLITQKIIQAINKTISLKCKFSQAQITILLVNDKFISELNLMYLGKASPTDVLTFDITEKKRNKDYLIADIVISTDASVKNAKIYKTRPTQELLLYTIHGVLHLLGFDDATSKQRERMDKKAFAILNSI
ncbi:MAG: rRNA maturation RNase YbeY [Candidatus Omnitrophota bacterium]